LIDLSPDVAQGKFYFFIYGLRLLEMPAGMREVYVCVNRRLTVIGTRRHLYVDRRATRSRVNLNPSLVVLNARSYR
jgi:hypothetical protein